jgi:hypothetical protein
MSDTDAFHLKEIEYLRKEIEYRTAGQVALERNVVIAISVVYAGLATLDRGRLVEPLGGLTIFFWFIPALIAIAGTARFFDDHYSIRNIGQYIAELEGRLDPQHGGWQRYRKAKPHFRRNLWWRTRMSIWYALIFVTLAIPSAFFLR